MTDNKRAELYREMRRESAVLLGYDDVNALTTAEALKVDLVTTLRMVTDDMQGRLIDGGSVGSGDVGRLLDAVTALTQMLPGKELPRTKGPFSRERQQAVLDRVYRVVKAAQEDDQAKEAKESEQLRQRVADLEAEIARLTGSPKALPVPPAAEAEALPNPPVVEQAAPPSSPPSPPPSPRWSPPSHWLRSGQPPEPWRPFVQATDVTHHLFMDPRKG
jgi:hypothetical protein